LVYISTPWTAFVSLNGLIDGVSAVYTLLAVHALLLRRGEHREKAAASPHALWCWSTDDGLVALCGFLAGAGVACKYPALLFLAAPLFVAVAWLQFRRWDPKAAVVYLAALLAGCGLWFAKNEVLAGNPTYPLLYRWLGGESWNDEQDARWRRAHGPPRDGLGRAYSLPQAADSAKVLLLTSDCLGVSLWPLAALAAFVRPFRRPLLWLAALIVWTTATWWLLTHRIDRFLIPLLPLAAVLAGVGATRWQSAAWRRICSSLLIGSCVASFLFDASGLLADNAFLASLRDEGYDIQRARQTGRRYLNEHVRPGYRALLVGEAQVWDVEVPMMYNTCFDDCQFEQLMRGRSREERLAALRERRISHIYFSWYELDRYRSPGNYGYSEYVTRERVRGELAQQQQLLRALPLEMDPESGEVYEVSGWQSWE
jgi:hypothetical protein